MWVWPCERAVSFVYIFSQQLLSIFSFTSLPPVLSREMTQENKDTKFTIAKNEAIKDDKKKVKKKEIVTELMTRVNWSVHSLFVTLLIVLSFCLYIGHHSTTTSNDDRRAISGRCISVARL